jgi:hypothetical protein
MENRKQKTGNRKLVIAEFFTPFFIFGFRSSVSGFLFPFGSSTTPTEKIDTLGKEGGSEVSFS